MTDHPRLMMLAVVIVTFIAGYAVVSYVVRKLKEGPFNPALTGKSQRSNLTTEDTSALDAGTDNDNAFKESDQED